MILSDVSILPVSQLQTQQVTTSLIRSHIEYLLQTYYMFVLFLVEIDKKILALIVLIWVNDDSW